MGKGEGGWDTQCCQEGARGVSQVPWVCQKAGVRGTCKRWDSGTEADLPFLFYADPDSKIRNPNFYIILDLDLCSCLQNYWNKRQKSCFPV